MARVRPAIQSLREKLSSPEVALCALLSSCELQSTVLYDGQLINVIDTPGMMLLPLSASLVRTWYSVISNIAIPNDLLVFFHSLSTKIHFPQPGLFDPAMDSDFVCKEIANCIKMAPDGIHSVILVSSPRNPFTEDEKIAVLSLQSFFGTKITDYMIVLFTGGDRFGDSYQPLAIICVMIVQQAML
ncbi:Immune-associated nucleotide-binding protein 9 [Linum grandiflorum]